MPNFTSKTLTFYRSLPRADFLRLLSKMPRDKQVSLLAAIKLAQEAEATSSSSPPTSTKTTSPAAAKVIDGHVHTPEPPAAKDPKPDSEFLDLRDRDADRKRRKRSQACRIYIPEVQDPARREHALSDPIRFLLTYFPDRYTITFGPHHERMIYDIVDRAQHGGRQAVAAPRGSGKSEIVKGLIIYLTLAGLTRFALIGAASGVLGRLIYRDIRSRFSMNDLLYADFPEVCHPVRMLEGAPQRASRQHVDGQLTNIVWTSSEYLRFPDVPGSTLGGIKIGFFGLDSAFRGMNIDGDRPSLVVIDDPETQASARSPVEVAKREQMLDKDISGLASQDDRLALVVLTTVQNSLSLSAKLTDRTLKPAYNGVRYGLITKWPDRMDLWEEYIALRHAAQREGDEHGRRAVAHYLANRAAMDEGSEMLVDHFTPQEIDGEPLIHSALQAAFNRIAETSFSAFRAEYQNDPEDADQGIATTLTAAKVQGRISDTLQRQLPAETERITIGIDVGKYLCHWTKIAWAPEATGTIIDYGIIETVNIDRHSDEQAIELAIASALEIFAEEQLALDPQLRPDLCLIDSGTFTSAVYEASRRIGRPFFPAKGIGSQFRMPNSTNTKTQTHLYEEAYSTYRIADAVSLYLINVDYWKLWTHERFLTDSYQQGTSMRTPGSLALFNPEGDRRRHLAYSQHIVAEELRLIPRDGKDYRREWYVKTRNNHWLDSTTYANAAAGACGVTLFRRREDLAAAIKPRPTKLTPPTGYTLSPPSSPYRSAPPDR